MIDERILRFRQGKKQTRRNGKRRVDNDSNVVGILSSDYIDRGDGLLIGLDTFTAANRHLLLPKTCPVSSDSLPRIIHFRYSYAKLRIHPTDEYNSLPLTALQLVRDRLYLSFGTISGISRTLTLELPQNDSKNEVIFHFPYIYNDALLQISTTN